MRVCCLTLLTYTLGFSAKKEIRSNAYDNNNIIIFLFTVALHTSSPSSVYCVIFMCIYSIYYQVHVFPGSQISFRFTGVDFGNARMVIVAHFLYVHDITHIYILSILSSIDFLFSLVCKERVWNFDSHPIFSCTRSREEVFFL